MNGITLKKLNAQIAAIGRKTAKWRDDVQLCLVGCAQHAFDSNNVDPCTRLVQAVRGADAKAIIHWIEAHMPAVWVKADEKFRFNKSFVGEYDAITLMAEPWWELATQPKNVASSLDMLDALDTFIKRMVREVEAGKKEVLHGEVLTELKALSGKMARTM